MKRQELFAVARQLGIPVSDMTVFRWRKGYFMNRKGKKQWYFPNHLKLEYRSSVNGIGYVYDRLIARRWLMALKKRKEN